MVLTATLTPSTENSFVISTQEPTGVEPTNRAPDDLTLWRMSVDQYHTLARAGILADEPIELLEGWLAQKMTKNPPHTTTTRYVKRALEGAMPSGWFVDAQEPITLADSEPEPDIVVVRGDFKDYQKRHPGPAEVAIVIEVSDSTLQRDRGLKKRVYARAKIAVYWLVNLIDNQIEVYTDPTGPTKIPDYREQKNYGRADSLPLILNGHEIAQFAVQDLLP